MGQGAKWGRERSGLGYKAQVVNAINPRKPQISSEKIYFDCKKARIAPNGLQTKDLQKCSWTLALYELRLRIQPISKVALKVITAFFEPINVDL